MMTTVYSETIRPSISAALSHLQDQRNDNMPVAVRAGINFSIVLGSACYLEGVLETGLKALLAHRRINYHRLRGKLREQRPMNFFYSRIEDDLEKRIRSSTGTDGYDPLFDLLIGQRLSKLPKVVPLWEGITVLFQLRNVLGHGREVMAKHVVASWTPKGGEEQFSGGYRRAEDYLRKKKLLDRKFTAAHSEYIFLADKIADHFWDLATQVPKAVSKSLEIRERRVFDKAVFSKP